MYIFSCTFLYGQTKKWAYQVLFSYVNFSKFRFNWQYAERKLYSKISNKSCFFHIFLSKNIITNNWKLNSTTNPNITLNNVYIAWILAGRDPKFGSLTVNSCIKLHNFIGEGLLCFVGVTGGAKIRLFSYKLVSL